jgi:hypothetical protein
MYWMNIFFSKSEVTCREIGIVLYFLLLLLHHFHSEGLPLFIPDY